jgi:hypothetical protein
VDGVTVASDDGALLNDGTIDHILAAIWCFREYSLGCSISTMSASSALMHRIVWTAMIRSMPVDIMMVNDWVATQQGAVSRPQGSMTAPTKLPNSSRGQEQHLVAVVIAFWLPHPQITCPTPQWGTTEVCMVPGNTCKRRIKNEAEVSNMS